MSQTTALDPQAIRTKNGLSPVPAASEGLSRNRVPNGTFGFTSAPGEPDGGLYSKQIFQSFEIHKLADGSIQILGYVTAQEAEMFHGGLQTLDVHMYPAVREAADTLISLPWARIRRSLPVSRIDGNYLPVTIAPLP
ncbi:MAG: hypothetical protein NTZ56_20130 [Acidobacteria bacterium]|nr:hypothetical protein [Acidobacteriota bacterium]